MYLYEWESSAHCPCPVPGSTISELSRKVKEENDYLERLKTMNTYSEWRQNTIARTARKKMLEALPDVPASHKCHRFETRTNNLPINEQLNLGTPAEQLANIKSTFGDTLIFLIVSANEYVLQAQTSETDVAITERAKGTEATSTKENLADALA